MGYMKCTVSVLSCFLLGACSSSSSDVSEVNMSEQDMEFLGGGSCTEFVVFNEEVGLPDSIFEAEGFFECGNLESLVSAQTGSMPTGSGTISLSNQNLSINSAAVEIIPDDEYDNHKAIQLYLHNGDVRVVDKRFELFDESGAGIFRNEIRWGIYSANYVLSLELASAAPDQFEVGNFEFIDFETGNPNDPAYSETNAIFNILAVNDQNENGLIDSLDEILDVESGRVTITGERPNWFISVDLQLVNGDSMTGQYSGDYIEVPLATEFME